MNCYSGPYAIFTPEELRRILTLASEAGDEGRDGRVPIIDNLIVEKCTDALTPSVQRTPVSAREEQLSRQGVKT